MFKGLVWFDSLHPSFFLLLAERSLFWKNGSIGSSLGSSILRSFSNLVSSQIAASFRVLGGDHGVSSESCRGMFHTNRISALSKVISGSVSWTDSFGCCTLGVPGIVWQQIEDIEEVVVAGEEECNTFGSYLKGNKKEASPALKLWHYLCVLPFTLKFGLHVNWLTLYDHVGQRAGRRVQR